MKQKIKVNVQGMNTEGNSYTVKRTWDIPQTVTPSTIELLDNRIEALMDSKGQDWDYSYSLFVTVNEQTFMTLEDMMEALNG